MQTYNEAEVKKSRYSQVEKEPDGFGRIIGVRRLKPSEQTRLAGMTADLTGSDEHFDDETQKKVLVPHRTPLILAASVCYLNDGVDELHIPFPKNRAELDAMYDRLDVEGLAAVQRAAIRLGRTEVIADPELAKNLLRTPSSDSSSGS